VIEHGGATLLRRYGSLQAALAAEYSDFNWDPSLFNGSDKHPAGYWNTDNLLKALTRMEELLGLKQARDYH